MLRDIRGRLAIALSSGQRQCSPSAGHDGASRGAALLGGPPWGSRQLVDDILAVLQRQQEGGLSMLLVEQGKPDLRGASLCLVVENGTVALSARSEDLHHDPRVRKIYLGL
jgi:branched-chain amino acid transport system ATP-binding protein